MAKDQTNDVVETTTEELKVSPEQTTAQSNPTTQTIVKKSGTGLSVLALLVALGLGGAGYYFGQQQVDNIQQKLTALERQSHQNSDAQNSVDLSQLTALEQSNKATQDKLSVLEQTIASKESQINALQAQLQQVSQRAGAVQQSSDWLYSEAGFSLKNALQKLVLDNDIDTAIALLKQADETLAKVNDAQATSIRAAIVQDLKQLGSLAEIDQNSVMQRLSQLANTVDELPALNVNFEENAANDGKLSDSIEDWQQNAEKSAMSFLNHFIRISPKHSADKKELLAPNQDIYLRENIRLRLQLAIMAVPRQQNDLYKESLVAVSSWVRSYFDTKADVTQQFLKSVDELAEQSVYVDAPTQLQSLVLIDKYLNRTPVEVKKVEIETDKAVESMPKAREDKAAEDKAVEEKPAEEKKTEEKPADVKTEATTSETAEQASTQVQPQQ